MEIKTEITINANAEKVRNVLTDFKSYPNRDIFIKSITGTPKVGSKILVTFDKMTFKPMVLSYEENKEFKWLGKLFIKGIFDGEHLFNLQENLDETTTLYHSEKFGGLLVPLFKKKLLLETKDNFQMMNMRLKEIAEQY